MSGRVGKFDERGCAILGVSTDDIDTHIRWLQTAPQDGGLGSLAFPLAADPAGLACQQYGVYIDRQHVSLRGLFMIDPNGVLQYQSTHSLSVGRSTDEVLRVLDALQSGGLCPGEREAGGPTIDVMSNLQPGRVLGPYKILSELGKGAFGTVLRAQDTLLDRSVALKVLRGENDAATDTLLNEARAVAALNHPNICMVHTVDTSNGVAMIVMEFVDGQSLAELIKDDSIPHTRAMSLAKQIAAGMSHAHSAGVVHGDLKPGNVVVTSTDLVKIMDFGLSRRIASIGVNDDTLPHSASPSGASLSGTLGYLAPELAQGESPSTSSDTFALGLILFEMLTGERAISGNNLLDTLHNIENFDGESCISKVPEMLRPILRRAFSRQPEERPTMEELALGLE